MRSFEISLKSALKLAFLLAALLLTAALRADDIVVVVHTDSAIQTLSASEIQKMYLGKTLNLVPQPILIDYKSTVLLRETFYAKATGKSLAYSVRLWARYGFSGRGTPPLLVSGQEDVEALLKAYPTQCIAYLEKQHIKPTMRIVHTVPANAPTTNDAH